jgi:hypothetical protein
MCVYITADMNSQLLHILQTYSAMHTDHVKAASTSQHLSCLLLPYV